MIYKGSPPNETQMFNTVRFYSPFGTPRNYPNNEKTRQRLARDQLKKGFCERLIKRLKEQDDKPG